MTDSKDSFFENEKGEQVFIPEGRTAEEVADDISAADKPQYVDVQTQPIEIPKGKTVEDVVNDLHEGPVSYVNESIVPDGSKSELMQRALQDKAEHENAADLTKGLALVSLMALDVADTTHILAPIIADETENCISINFETIGAFQIFQGAVESGIVTAIQIHTSESEAKEPEDFLTELTHLINKHSVENGSDTPDYILAEYMARSLSVYEETVKARDQWTGVPGVRLAPMASDISATDFINRQQNITINKENN